MFQVHVCDSITGARIESIKAVDFPYMNLLSAQGEGTVSVPLDGSFTPAQLDMLFEEWRHIIVLERDGVVKFGGYVVGEPFYSDESATLQVDLIDIWGMLSRRLAVDHSVPHAEKWSQTVTADLGTHANQILIWARDTYTGTPAAGLPLTIPGTGGGPIFTRPYYGYNLQFVDEAFTQLLDLGLDIYFHPEWNLPGVFGWRVMSGPGWTSGVTREFSVTAPASQIVGFERRRDGRRVTNNAVRVGEGTEVDMLAISNLDMTSPLPLLERVTVTKDVTLTSLLSIAAGEDLVTYGEATEQWELEILSDADVGVGDMLRLHFDGHRRVPDGWYTRRVVKVQSGMGHYDKVSVQPTGGA